jgi:hypothetical protein
MGTWWHSQVNEARDTLALFWPKGAEYRREQVDGEWFMVYYGVEDIEDTQTQTIEVGK